MSVPISKDALDKLKQFIEVCKSNSTILNTPELKFFKDYIESFGGKIPEASKMSEEPKTESKGEPQKFVDIDETVASDPESELEFDMTGCVEPDKLDDKEWVIHLKKFQKKIVIRLMKNVSKLCSNCPRVT